MQTPGDPSIDSVLAGTPNFVTAISPAVKSRAGAEPRVAADPREAFTYCAENGGLLVMEYAGPEWLPVVRDLRSLCGDAISVVVAVAQERMAEVSGLQHAGADEVVAWDGRADAVAWAVERILASRGRGVVTPAPPASAAVRGWSAPAPAPPTLQRAPAPAPPPPPPFGGLAPPAAGPAPGPVPQAAAAPPAVPAPPAAFTIREAPEAAAPAASAAGPAPAPAPPAWPAAVLPGPEAERLLAAVVTGAASEPGPARAVAAQTAQGLSDLERRALADVPMPLDGALFRRASALRLRVALALGSAPPPGTPIDSAAVQSLLAELDSALAELKTSAEVAGAEHQRGLAALRTALVKEAIDLTDAVHRIAPSAAPTPEPAARAPRARLLSNRSALAEPVRPRARRGWLILLLLAGLAAGGFHLYQATRPRAEVQRTTMAGAPPGSSASSTGRSTTRVVVSEAGKPFDPAAVERFRREQEQRGMEVIQVAPGTLVVRPAAQRKTGGAP
jgi:hypothetical protein